MWPHSPASGSAAVIGLSRSRLEDHRCPSRHHISANAAFSAKSLSPEQSGRTWKVAEILTKATSILGPKEEAEQWLERPAMGLDQRKPIDPLTTPAGVELVEDFLVRLEYGVYA
jgi:putative toxin-antitoxin system antitoxin component (TIGR02293 family)